MIKGLTIFAGSVDVGLRYAEALAAIAANSATQARKKERGVFGGDSEILLASLWSTSTTPLRTNNSRRIDAVIINIQALLLR